MFHRSRFFSSSFLTTSFSVLVVPPALSARSAFADHSAKRTEEIHAAQDKGNGKIPAKIPDGPRTKVVVALDWTPNTNHSGLYAAKAIGAYARHGLEVSFVQPAQTTATALTATRAGAVRRQLHQRCHQRPCGKTARAQRGRHPPAQHVVLRLARHRGHPDGEGLGKAGVTAAGARRKKPRPSDIS